MKVKELIELLQKMDEDKDVYIDDNMGGMITVTYAVDYEDQFVYIYTENA